MPDDNSAQLHVLRNRIRLTAKRRGYGVSRTRTRDPLAADYGVWTVTDLATGRVVTTVKGDDECLAVLNRPRG